MLGVDAWTIVAAVAYSVAVTLGTMWLVGRLAGPHRHTISRPWTAVLASIIWMALLFVASVIAVRYAERIDQAVLGYLGFAAVGILASLLRARLYWSAEEAHQPAPPLSQAQLVHTLTAILVAGVLYLVLHWLLGRPVQPLLLTALVVGVMLANLDVTDSLSGRLLPFISRRMAQWLGPNQGWHSVVGALIVGLTTAPLLLLIPWRAWVLLPLGFVCHLMVDMLEPQGAMLLWPWRRIRYHVPGTPIRARGDATERKLAVGLVLAAVVLLLLVDFGPPPSPPVTAPSYEQILERYYGLRGRNLVFASVQGTWQVTGQRISGRFEILNAVDSSYIMLDRYTGRVFTAGRNGEDNLYLNYIDLQTGDAVTIKPAEIHLDAQPLADALPVIYQMQREPGLQYIYASGRLQLPSDEPGGQQLALSTTCAPTDLRRIQRDDAGGYNLRYLSAAELIALSKVQVESADLVIFATYVSPPAGPTATPLPLVATPSSEPGGASP
ncbi:MAG: metal-dependent hydrolase [Anaerolineae bacterium]